MTVLIDIPYWKDILVRSSQEVLQLRQHIQPQPLPLLHICSDALSANNIKPIYRIHFLLLQAGFALTQGCAGKWSTAAQLSQMYMTSLHAQKPPFHLPACRQKRVDTSLWHTECLTKHFSWSDISQRLWGPVIAHHVQDLAPVPHCVFSGFLCLHLSSGTWEDNGGEEAS